MFFFIGKKNDNKLLGLIDMEFNFLSFKKLWGQLCLDVSGYMGYFKMEREREREGERNFGQNWVI